MEYNIQWIKDKFDAEERIKYIFFWGHQPQKDGGIGQSCLSQWWEQTFEFEKVVYKTAEHWMMAGKAKLFDDQDIFEKIINCNSPAEAKKLGRKVKNFDNKTWETNRFEIVRQGNYLKFSQNEELKSYLLKSGDRVIVEASPVDAIWGIGLKKEFHGIENPYHWKGLNLLGFALMQVRDDLRSSESN